MKEEKEKRMKELYALAQSSKEAVPPKRAVLAWKCPKCSGKLAKESLKEVIGATEGSGEFANKVVSDAGLDPGIYTLSIDHFTCKCGYEFAKAGVEVLPDSAA